MIKNSWKQLFTRALTIIKASPLKDHLWTFGGGTVLSLRYKHRISHDVDIFFTDAQILPVISPRLNHQVMLLASSYQEGANFVKLEFPEGEIDFILAPCLTENCYTTELICGEPVRVESSGEIMAKKLFFRSETLRARDIVDIAIVYQEDRESALSVAKVFLPKMATVERRWKKMLDVFRNEVQGIDLLVPDLEWQVPRLFDDFLADVRRLESK